MANLIEKMVGILGQITASDFRIVFFSIYCSKFISIIGDFN